MLILIAKSVRLRVYLKINELINSKMSRQLDLAEKNQRGTGQSAFKVLNLL